MIKVFTTNKNGKIELTADEIKKLLDEAYWEGYCNASNCHTFTYSSPSIASPYQWTVNTSDSTLKYSDPISIKTTEVKP